MSTGLFANRQNSTLKHAPARARANAAKAKPAAAPKKSQQEQRWDRIEAFAELLAEGYAVSEAAKKVGVATDTGRNMMQTIRAGLGRQAR